MLSFEVCAMACICGSGGRFLNGEIKIQGSKNAVLPTLAAALLNTVESKSSNCLDNAVVRAMAALLK